MPEYVAISLEEIPHADMTQRQELEDLLMNVEDPVLEHGNTSSTSETQFVTFAEPACDQTNLSRNTNTDDEITVLADDDKIRTIERPKVNWFQSMKEDKLLLAELIIIILGLIFCGYALYWSFS